MEIRNPYFEKIQVPTFALGFTISDFLPKNKFASSNYQNTDYTKADLLEKILMEFRSFTIIDCKLKNNGVYENCDSFTQPNIDIYLDKPNDKNEPDQLINGVNIKTKLKNLYDLIESFKKRPNETIIDQLKIHNQYVLVLSYLLFNQNERNSHEFNKSIIPTNTIKETDFIKLSINSSEYYDHGLYLSIKKESIKDKKGLLLYGKIYGLNIIKKSFEFLEFPYESKCSYYENFKTIFRSSSHTHCIRQCIRRNCEIELKCSCIGLENTISQMDYDFQKMEICRKDEKFMESFILKTTTFCTSLCPKDCINDEYLIVVSKANFDPFAKNKLIEFTVSWDVSKPFITNRETPVMTFTDYFCYIGGLFGMWFGISANQLFNHLVIFEKQIPRYFSILFYHILSYVFLTKRAFHFILQYILQKLFSLMRNIKIITNQFLINLVMIGKQIIRYSFNVINTILSYLLIIYLITEQILNYILQYILRKL
jgi:hypothetical protein